MSVEAIEPTPGLFGRIKQLIADPPKAWDAIAREETQPGALIGGHVLPLAIVSAAASVLGVFLAAGFKVNAETAIVQPAAALVGLVLALIGVSAFAKLADLLAPRFGGTPDATRSAQLSAYGATGVLLGGLGALLPGIAPYVIAVGGAFSLVLIYIGLPRMMGAPEDKRIGYFWSLIGVVLTALIAVGLAFGPLMNGVRDLAHQVKFGAAEQVTPNEAAPAALPEGAVLDGAAILRIGEANSEGPAATVDRLEGFLPPTLPGGFARTDYAPRPSAKVSQVQGAYARDSARLTITITHLGLRGSLAVIDAAERSLATRVQDANAFARHQVSEGRLIAENVNGAAVNYAVIGRGVAVSVSAEGGATIDDARAAVETIEMSRLEDAFAP